MEGPSIIILLEEVKSFTGKKILEVSGNSKIDQQALLNQKIIQFRSWGKHFLICFHGFFVRIHFLMYGSYRINEEKNLPPRLSLRFKNGVLNFYSCAIILVNEKPEDIYDFETDVMAPAFNEKKAINALKKNKAALICDALLDQNIFSGVGNIIKNEVLYRLRLHPETPVGGLNPSQLRQVVREARTYSFEFYEWKKKFELKKHWLIYRKKKCPSCGRPITIEYTGAGQRISYYCSYCQSRV